MPCRRCQIGLYLVEEASLLSRWDKEAALARAGNWHEQCEGKDCDCGCPKRSGLLSRVRAFLTSRSLPEMVRAML